MQKQSKPQGGSSGQRLEFVRCFLRDIANDMSFMVDIPNSLDFWSRQNEGVLQLSPKMSENYRGVCKELQERFAQDEALSESAIDTALRTAVFEVVDIPKRRDNDLCARLDRALADLEQSLTRPLEEFKCWIRVGGLEVDSLPATFGCVRFVTFGSDQIQEIKTFTQTEPNIWQTGECQSPEGFSITDPVRDLPVAEVRVNARDAQAAKLLAERKVLATTECINFFSDLVAGAHTWLYLPGLQESRSSGSYLIVDSSGYIHSEAYVTGPMDELSIAKLRSTDGTILKAVTRVDSLLKKQRNKVEEMILTGVRWGGRATVANAWEESFLLSAIALECLILPEQNEELTYRLSQRVARLLGKDFDVRLELAKRTKALYSIRSKIVHNGHYEVTEQECNEIRAIAKNVILELLTNLEVEGFCRPKELHEYFECQSLK